MFFPVHVSTHTHTQVYNEYVIYARMYIYISVGRRQRARLPRGDHLVWRLTANRKQNTDLDLLLFSPARL